MTEAIQDYRKVFEDALQQASDFRDPQGLYAPIRYILNLGGKRMRPVLVLMSADLYGASFERAMPAALAVEVFHNFSLIHDDIMDQAPVRRGQPSVHIKWDTNTGILSGDAMLIRAYQFLGAYEPEVFKPMMELFSKTALQVCEGQQYDMEFETKEVVRISDYLRMIEYKTAVLLGCALQMGAMAGAAPKSEQEALYAFGIYLGMAFQLQDDYLDVFGDPDAFGKQVGGDIIENKKTYLYLRALELAAPAARRELCDLYSIRPSKPASKVKRVTELFRGCGVDSDIRKKIRSYTDEAFKQLERIDSNAPAARSLKAFGEWLLQREF